MKSSDHLEKSYNLDIQESAEKETQTLLNYIKSIEQEFSYEFIQIEGDGMVCLNLFSNEYCR